MKLIEKYRENEQYLETLEVNKPDRIKSFILGYLISLLLILAPLVICAHFFIYSFYEYITLAILMFIILIFIILGEYFSEQLLIQYSKTEIKKDLKITYMIHFGIYFAMMLLGYVIITLL